MNTAKSSIIPALAMALLAMLCSAPSFAQGKPTAANKSIVGVWVMESMQFEGENKIVCGKGTGYSQVKYYGKDGEYACAQIAKSGNNYVVLPHEYGTYTYKDGVYTEMGRKPSSLSLSKDGKHFYGQWFNRHDAWVRRTDIPKELIDFIILQCKLSQPPSPKIQAQIKQSFFAN
ncbi:MAG: hypothetical protein KBT29_06860 [Prevotellaceae bacterium]|nr:hypothetical protein [Candidatus Minthosoma caballi]